MSKFLKFIVHFIVICTIVCVVGLAVPPFFGITTEIMDDSGKETNLPIGSVTYAIPAKASEAAVGDFILYQSDSKAYRYMITEMDKENNIFKVVDSTDKDAEPITVEVKKYIPKVVITIGYVGYLLTATESIEGLIILGLAVLFLIILYIVAELLKKEPQDDYDDTDTEPGYVKSKKELKKEEKAREKRYKEEERQIKKEERARKKGKAPERKKIKTIWNRHSQNSQQQYRQLQAKHMNFLKKRLQRLPQMSNSKLKNQCSQWCSSHRHSGKLFPEKLR